MSKAKLEAQLSAAYEAVARLLARTLTVPKIFFEAAWPTAQRRVDILAIDRAGAGDVHVIEVKQSANADLDSTIRQLSRLPAHFRWLATPMQAVRKPAAEILLSRLRESGIGVIAIVTMANGEPGANVLFKPTRAESFDRSRIGDLLSSRVPDIEYGELPPASLRPPPAILSKDKIRKHLDEADDLIRLGHRRAGHLLAWSAVEAAMKLILGESADAALPSTGALIRAMRDSGKLSASEADSLIHALSIRHMLAHGLEDPSDTDKAYRAVAGIARKLVNGRGPR